METRRFLKLMALVLAVAAVAAGIALTVYFLQPSRAVMERRAAAPPPQHAVSPLGRQQGLMAVVLTGGIGAILAVLVRGTNAALRRMNAGEISLRGAFATLGKRALAALGYALAILIAVPVLEAIFYSGDGMYGGEQGLAAFFTVAIFLAVWLAGIGIAVAVLIGNRSSR